MWIKNKFLKMKFRFYLFLNFLWHSDVFVFVWSFSRSLKSFRLNDSSPRFGKTNFTRPENHCHESIRSNTVERMKTQLETKLAKCLKLKTKEEKNWRRLFTDGAQELFSFVNALARKEPRSGSRATLYFESESLNWSEVMIISSLRQRLLKQSSSNH